MGIVKRMNRRLVDPRDPDLIIHPLPELPHTPRRPCFCLSVRVLLPVPDTADRHADRHAPAYNIVHAARVLIERATGCGWSLMKVRERLLKAA